MKVEFEEVELREAAQFNKYHGLGSFPFSDLIFLAFVDSLMSATVAGRNTEPFQPHPTLAVIWHPCTHGREGKGGEEGTMKGLLV